MQAQPTNKNLLKLRQVQERAQWSSTTLWRMEKRGTLIPIRIDGQRYWKESDVDKLTNGDGG
jgi:predicted DNA-binding transcriptional regulator AlpA|tara:strand:+ start:167 stop:352 length:186 start_codon:yes stop_codon:yes gene_type:complete